MFSLKGTKDCRPVRTSVSVYIESKTKHAKQKKAAKTQVHLQVVNQLRRIVFKPDLKR